MSQALYRKWRPHLWEKVVGQEHIIHTLQNAIRSNRVGHAYLFAGPRGTGKTSTARLLAKAVNCLDPDPAKHPCDQCDHCKAVNENRFLDLIEIDAASNTSVDDVRDLRDKINFSPTQGQYKVYIIDEVHMLSTAAFNALLKTLEEPPAHAIFILATTEVHKIPATVLSRCQRHEFRRIPVQDIVAHLSEMVKDEGMQIEPEALTLIARQSTGAMRDAISLLDQLSSTGEKITLKMAQEVLGTATSQVVVDLVNAVQQREPAAGLDAIHTALDSGTDPRQFARQVVDYLRGLLLIRLGNSGQVDATADMRAQMARHAQAYDLPHLLNAVRLFNNAASDTRSSWQPALLLELALTEAMETPAAAPMPTQPAAPAASQPAVSPPAVPAAVPTAPAPVSAKAEAAQPANPPPAASQNTLSLQDINKVWRRIRDVVKERSRATEALLNSCKLVAVKDGVLVLGFATEVLRAKMDTRDNLDLTTQAISQVLSAQMPIACIVMSGKAGSAPPDLDVDSDGMIGTALNLGGQIVHKD